MPILKKPPTLICRRFFFELFLVVLILSFALKQKKQKFKTA